MYRYPLLDEAAGANVYVKHENHTPVGAFKVRGGYVFLDWLVRERPDVRGVISATRGNHGQSITIAARRAGLSATIVVPHGNSREKNAAMRAQGAELIEDGRDFQEAREIAERIANERGLFMVPSFHSELVRGVASYALELLESVADIGAVYVPIGLGSGICGTIAARDALGLATKIVGVVSTGARAYQHSFARRGVVETESVDTFVDGVACRVPVPEAVATIVAGADRVVDVSDREVEEAMRTLYRATHNVAEPAGAIAFAALLRDREILRGKNVAFVFSGGNVDASVFARVLATSS